MTEKPKTPLGVHMLLDLVEAPFAQLDDPLRVKAAIFEAVRELHARVLSTQIHRLQPQGVTGFVIISESHLAIHTWPDRGEAAVDLFTCGDPERGRAALRLVTKRLGGRERQLKEVIRGPIAE